MGIGRQPDGRSSDGRKIAETLQCTAVSITTLYSERKDPKTGKRRNLGTFDTREAAKKHEREVEFFKRKK